MKLAVRIKTDETTEIMDISGDCLTALQGAVGGYVETVSLKDDLTMWVNEEGKIHELEVNTHGTVIYAAALRSTDLIVGDIVLTGGTDAQGEVIGLKDKQVADIIEWSKNGHKPFADLIKRGIK